MLGLFCVVYKMSSSSHILHDQNSLRNGCMVAAYYLCNGCTVADFTKSSCSLYEKVNGCRPILKELVTTFKNFDIFGGLRSIGHRLRT